MYAGGLRAAVKSGGDPVGRIEEGINTKATDVVGVNQSSTDRAGAFRSSTFDTTTCGAISAQQSIGGTSNETEGFSWPVHCGICDPCVAMAPGTQVATADVTTATITQSATIPVARIRIINIVDRTVLPFVNISNAGHGRKVSDANNAVLNDLTDSTVAMPVPN